MQERKPTDHLVSNSSIPDEETSIGQASALSPYTSDRMLGCVGVLTCRPLKVACYFERYAECYRQVSGPYRTKTTVQSVARFANFRTQFCKLVRQQRFPLSTAYSSMGGDSFAGRVLIRRIWTITARLGDIILFQGAFVRLRDISVNGMESKVRLGICDDWGCISVETITFDRFISQEPGCFLGFGPCS